MVRFRVRDRVRERVRVEPSDYRTLGLSPYNHNNNTDIWFTRLLYIKSSYLAVILSHYH